MNTTRLLPMYTNAKQDNILTNVPSMHAHGWYACTLPETTLLIKRHPLLTHGVPTYLMQ